ncbi:peptidoglycan-associated lipoprotein [Leptospirillum ferriphilum]|jgi:outer membrane protein OmpA-like peptidoglycan-associated protein|uniref:Peptidoglycan-associated lipoprotein n=2 Tax=Leptospirillum TaxID=179 RepID=A0A094YLG2_9BACT|nr:MAG: Putative Outer membrane protein, OmpAfamily [Leptospirillum sp. Group II '5-way CG']KGA94031.1 peptidoglycan-associated lipoprotein [Leptospirillum ferriphilum]MCL5259618.1 OmpA family protein [Nitrospirota bacterium]
MSIPGVFLLIRSVWMPREKRNPFLMVSPVLKRVICCAVQMVFFLGTIGGFSPEARADPPANTPGEGMLLHQDKKLLRRIQDLSRQDLSFATGKADLNQRDRRILREDAVLLKRYPKVEILLIGHSDERGNEIYNFRLGLDRGKSARQFLEDLGIAASRIHVVSFGKRAIPGRLLCARHRESCWRRHRIVHVVGYLPDEKVAFRSPPPVRPLPAPPARVVTVQGEKRRKGTYLLLPAGKVEVENVFLYLHDTSTQVASQNFSLFPILPSSTGVNIQRVDEDYYIEMIAVFLGVTDKLEVEADIPYVYRTQTAVTSPVTASGGTGAPVLSNQFGRGLGDIDYGVHYQFNTEPFLGVLWMGNVIAKSTTGTNPFTLPVNSATGLLNDLPTGTGFWSLEPGLSLYFPITPVVFYANLNYIYNFSRSFGGALGTINPGNATDLSFGGWFSFSQKTIFTVGYDQMTIWPPSENGLQVPLTRVLQLGSVLFGGTYNVNPKFFFMVNVAAGVTPDAPNVAISIRFPLFF